MGKPREEEMYGELTESQARDLLVGALEGGSNYWYQIVGHKFPVGVKYEDFQPGGQFTTAEYYHPEQLIPFVQGCTTLVETSDDPNESQIKRLHKGALELGAIILKKKYPHHLSAAMLGEDDADTADAYFQCCLFGEIVFG